MDEEQFRTLLDDVGVNNDTIAAFRRLVYEFYRREARADLPWRQTRDPYYILVSEIMLQQTQVDRVRKKYIEFIQVFPGVADLAEATLQDVLVVWQGLGYNRRGMALKRAAEQVMARFGGVFPATVEELRSLPGIGPYTAGAVAAFAYDRPEVFIETNIRSVFLHLFHGDRQGVTDRELLPLVEATLHRERPREWYSALMDYGAMLKRTTRNPGRRSAHHVRQSPFKGSNRELRSRLLKWVLAGGEGTEENLAMTLDRDIDQVRRNLRDLEAEGFIVRRGDGYEICK